VKAREHRPLSSITGGGTVHLLIDANGYFQ
jgi:hypothetical protein